MTDEKIWKSPDGSVLHVRKSSEETRYSEVFPYICTSSCDLNYSKLFTYLEVPILAWSVIGQHRGTDSTPLRGLMTCQGDTDNG